MSGLTKEQLEALGAKQPEAPAGMLQRQVTPAQRAYGLLWRSVTDLPFVNMARRELYESLSKDERYAAIAWVVETHGSMTTNEILAADIRVGQFPERSI